MSMFTRFVDGYTTGMISVLDHHTGITADETDFTWDAQSSIRSDCEMFVATHRHAISRNPELAGELFALVRNNESAGFEGFGRTDKEMTESAKSFGESVPYFDENGLVELYQSEMSIAA